jgi:hypothetical protein
MVSIAIKDVVFMPLLSVIYSEGCDEQELIRISEIITDMINILFTLMSME